MARTSRSRVLPVLLLAFLVGAIAPPTATLLAAQTGSTVIGMRGDSGNTGAMPGTGPAGQPSILWEGPGTDGIVMGMAIRDDRLFVATKDPGVVTALDRATGGVTWSVDLGEESTTFGPEVAGDLIVLGLWAASGNAVVALDAATGAERWRVATDNLPTAPVVSGDTLYVAAEGGLEADSSLYALDAATGEQRWAFPAPDALDLGERVSVSDGVVVASAWSLSDNGVGVYAFDAATGEVLWTFSEIDEVTTTPVVGHGVVLITDLPRTWALDLRTGAILWEHSGQSTGGGQALDATAAYLAYGDQVQAVALRDGAPLWSAPVSGVAGPPVVAGGLVYTAVWKRSDDLTNHWLHAFDAATGGEVWALEIEHRVNGNQPLAHDGVLYVDTNSAVVAFGGPATSTGAPTESADDGGPYTSEQFGYTVTWTAPWHLSEPQSSTEEGRDNLTLLTGDARLAVNASAEISSPEEMIRFYTSNLGPARDNEEVVEVIEAPDLSRATTRYTVDDIAWLEYVEVRPLPGGGILLTVLSAPADWFTLAWQATQQLVSVDQAPPFAETPAVTGA